MVKNKPAVDKLAAKKVTAKSATAKRVAGSVLAQRPSVKGRATSAASIAKVARSALAETGPRSRSPAASARTMTPTVVRFFLADDVRQEVHGKVTVVGLYADNVVVAEMSPGHRKPSEKVPAAIPGVSLLASVSIAPGEHRYRMEIDRSSVTPQMIDAKTTTLMSARPGESINLIMRFAPLVFVRFGMVHVLLHVDDQPYQFSFEVRRGDTVQ